MPYVPAICDTCGTIFKSGFFAENSFNISFAGCTSGPCPKCGGSGHIPDGKFNFIGNAIEVLSAPERTVKELQKLSHILQSAQKEERTSEQIEEEIEKETPQFASILELLPKTREEKRSDLVFWITFILTMIQMILPFFQNEEKPAPKIEVNQVINQVYQETEINNNNLVINRTGILPNNQAIKHEPIRVKKIGRNDPCPCGSGKKYKHCHLQLQTQQ